MNSSLKLFLCSATLVASTYALASTGAHNLKSNPFPLSCHAVSGMPIVQCKTSDIDVYPGGAGADVDITASFKDGKTLPKSMSCTLNGADLNSGAGNVHFEGAQDNFKFTSSQTASPWTLESNHATYQGGNTVLYVPIAGRRWHKDTASISCTVYYGE